MPVYGLRSVRWLLQSKPTEEHMRSVQVVLAVGGCVPVMGLQVVEVVIKHNNHPTISPTLHRY